MANAKETTAKNQEDGLQKFLPEIFRSVRLLLVVVFGFIIFYFGQRSYIRMQSTNLAISTYTSILREKNVDDKVLLLQYLASLDPDNAVLAKHAKQATKSFEQRALLDQKTREIQHLRNFLRAQANANIAEKQGLNGQIAELEREVGGLQKEIRYYEISSGSAGCPVEKPLTETRKTATPKRPIHGSPFE